MALIHKTLINGKWFQMTLNEQMANIGSEVERALKWREKGYREHGRSAFDRALELLDLTLSDKRYKFARIKEIARVRELLCEYLEGDFDIADDGFWKRYFNPFYYAARKNV